ncbi:hypothetical protein SNEBB_008456 [Seison nebaliae]|nr:hypothetical protein SNEBB_008456 [Seison nebaliae]
MSGDIGLIGLAVMGQNLVLNMNDKGFKVVVYNRTASKMKEFLANGAAGTEVTGAETIEELCNNLSKPRKIMLMVRAGNAVDETIDQLIPHLTDGDVIIDGGNSEYEDTQRRCERMNEYNLLYIGTGISGGEDGARYGPSIMPGGMPEAWSLVKNIFQTISAKVDAEPCCDWVGNNGAGHFVKMVHNGIEYGDMQLICEAYSIMKDMLQMEQSKIASTFDKWNHNKLKSYLIEITSDILKFKDTDDNYLLPKIRDTAGQKGTGKWTAMASLTFGQPVTLISEAVYGRFLSSLKGERESASNILQISSTPQFKTPKSEFISQIEQALYASKLISYAQGFMLLKAADEKYDWNLNYGAIALMWRGGCIIRSDFLGKIKDAFSKNPNLVNLMLDDYFSEEIRKSITSWRNIVAAAVLSGIPIPCFSAALSFFDGYRNEHSSANLIQAQRDYFGAHTYELEKAPGEFHHTNWTGHGGATASGKYNA